MNGDWNIHYYHFQFNDGTYEVMGYMFNVSRIENKIEFDNKSSKITRCTIEKMIERITEPKTFSS